MLAYLGNEAPSRMTNSAKTATAVAAAVLWLALLWVPHAHTMPQSGGSELDNFAAILLPGRLTLDELGRTPTSAIFSLALRGGAKTWETSSPGKASTGHKKRPGRAWLEMGAFVAISNASYWIRSAFPEDWQFQLTLDSQIPRIFFLEGWRFDSNNFKLNWTHSLAGGLYYEFARACNMSWLESWLMAVAASTYWEVVVEWKEVISTNDQLTTGIAGLAVGEPWYQIGHYLSHQSGFLLQVLSFLNPVVKFNHWLDRKEPGARDYVQPGWHDFSLFAGVRHLASSGKASETGAYFGFHTRLLGLPEYGKPGDIRETLKDTYWSEISLDYAVRNGHADETNLYMGAVPWGHYRQKINDGLEGYSLTIGLGSSFEYFKKKPVDLYDYAPVPAHRGFDLHLEQPRNFTDKLAILHLAGPVLDWTVFRRGLKVRTVAEAYVDFALVNSYALNEYSQLHHTPPLDTIDGMKTTVLYYGYYYAFGGTLSGKTDLEWRGLRAQALASFGAWSSVDIWDRFQDEITNNAHLDDNRFRWLLGAGWKLPRVPLELFVHFEGIRRWGRLLDVRVHGLEKRTFAGLEFSF
jgi:hypothetical protein